MEGVVYVNSVEGSFIEAGSTGFQRVCRGFAETATGQRPPSAPQVALSGSLPCTALSCLAFDEARTQTSSVPNHILHLNHLLSPFSLVLVTLFAETSLLLPWDFFAFLLLLLLSVYSLFQVGTL